MKPLFITTPIYYVNDVPHIGHAYTTIAADVLARHYRQFGRPVFFLTGTDEHGLKVQKAAAARGIDPKKHCDETVDRFIQLWRALNISNDAFIRTTDTEHQQFVCRALSDLQAKLEIEPRDYVGFYCVPCERFWTDKDLQEGQCPDCRRPVDELTEKNYFFKMGRRRDQIVQAIQSGRMSILPESRRNEVIGFLEQPLTDLCISRPKKRLEWGIPLPFDADYVTYVWFDALLNYSSALAYTPRQTGAVKTPKWEEAEIVHLIGKDILTTHAVYWPAMLMALDRPLPSTIVAHGWWTVEGQKMSKSLGNVIDPGRMAATFGVDAFRYFLLREVPFGLDGDFSTSALTARINHDLADEFGNLVGRISALATQKENGILTISAYRPEGPDGVRIKSLAASKQATESFQFSIALTELAHVFSDLNKKITDDRPWEAAAEKRRETLATCAVDLARAIFLLSPYMPTVAVEAAARIGCSKWFSDPPKLFSDQQILSGKEWMVAAGAPLVAKIEVARRAETPVPKPDLPSGGKPMIEAEDFQKVELRTAKILEAERVPKSEKLIRILVAIGPGDADRRQIVAGIGRQYSPEQLIGKTVAIVANLQPRKIFGVESQGMILAAGTDTDVRVLTVDGDVQPGLQIK